MNSKPDAPTSETKAKKKMNKGKGECPATDKIVASKGIAPEPLFGLSAPGQRCYDLGGHRQRHTHLRRSSGIIHPLKVYL